MDRDFWLTIGVASFIYFISRDEISTGTDVSRKSFLGMNHLPRSVRNNNPGNIRKSTETWQGEIKSSDPEFKQFETFAWGTRAMIKLLFNYIDRGYNTIEKILNRWAPPSENDTEAYIRDVVNFTGIPRDRILSKNEAKPIIIRMSEVEAGSSSISSGMYNYAKTLV